MGPWEETTPDAKAAEKLTHYLLHKYYCENDVEAVIDQFDDHILWMGAGEEEYAVGTQTVTGIFRQFAGMVPKCVISDEHYDVMQVAPGVYVCTGRVWISTDPSTQICLRVHQRITTVSRVVDGRLRCCHIHISNPYEEMMEGDVGFPTQMANQSFQYLQEQIEAQKKQIAAQTELLQRLSFEDSLTGVYNRNKFMQLFSPHTDLQPAQLGVACFDLNGLKSMNDWFGHSAGDELIRQAAKQIRTIFGDKVYRTGGDEFVVVDSTRDRQAFEAAVQQAQTEMKEQKISCSVGCSWRGKRCNIKAQFDEADRRMYEDKRSFYSQREHDRRGRKGK